MCFTWPLLTKPLRAVLTLLLVSLQSTVLSSPWCPTPRPATPRWVWAACRPRYSYSSACGYGAKAVLVCVCVCVSSAVSVQFNFPLVSQPRRSSTPENSFKKNFFLACYLVFSPSVCSNILTFTPAAFPKAEERIQGEASTFLCLAFLLFTSPRPLRPLSVILLFVEEACWSFITLSLNLICVIHFWKPEQFCFCLSVTFFLQQIRKLRRELESSQDKVSNLTTQLSANVCIFF